MGTFFAEVHLASPSRPDRRESVKLLVDSGSMDTWVSAGALRDLGLQPSERRRVLTIGGKSHRTWSQTTSKSWVLTPSKDSGWGSTPSSVASFPPSFTAR